MAAEEDRARGDWKWRSDSIIDTHTLLTQAILNGELVELWKSTNVCSTFHARNTTTVRRTEKAEMLL